MTKDWLWGAIAVLPGVFVGFLLTSYLGLFGKLSFWWAIVTIFSMASVLATSVLWLANRRSVRRAQLASQPIQLYVRPFNAVIEAPIVCCTCFGIFALGHLVFGGDFKNWQVSLFISSASGYIIALKRTAYTSLD